MTLNMKFLLYMGISPATGAHLKETGHETVHLTENEMERSSDLEILDVAGKEKMIVLTHDLDFARLLAFSGASMPSVIIFRLQDMRPKTVNTVIDQVLQQFSDALEKGAILSVGDKKIRCHLLPINRG